MPSSGVMDPISAKMANRMVDNFSNELLIEFAFGGVKLEMLVDTTIAIAGAGKINRTVDLRAEQSFSIPSNAGSVWGYIAIRGGWRAERVLGSCSYHGRSKMGKAIEVGSVLFSDKQPTIAPLSRFVTAAELGPITGRKVVRVCRGPHFDQFKNTQSLCERQWTVAAEMDRTGYRLVQRLQAHSLSVKSFPLLAGCLQLPPSGHPIVTMPDGPTVGGYPVVAVVHPEDLPLLAQTGAGMKVQFEWYDCDKL